MTPEFPVELAVTNPPDSVRAKLFTVLLARSVGTGELEIVPPVESGPEVLFRMLAGVWPVDNEKDAVAVWFEDGMGNITPPDAVTFEVELAPDKVRPPLPKEGA